jgi:hypothetical protein
MVPMSFRMLTPIHQFKIFNSIIRSNSIDVMHCFKFRKGATEMLFHNNPMQQSHLPIDSLNQVSTTQCWPWRIQQCVRVPMPPPPEVMDAAHSSRLRFTLAKLTYIHSMVFILAVLASCQSSPEPISCSAWEQYLERQAVKYHACLEDKGNLRQQLKACQERR